MRFLPDRRSLVRIYLDLRTLKRRRWTIPPPSSDNLESADPIMASNLIRILRDPTRQASQT